MSENKAPASAGSPTAVIAVLAFTGIAVAVQGTMVIPLLVKLPALLHTSSANTSWVVTATLLAGAVATPVSGRLGDMYGKRRLIFVSLGLLTAGSLICASTSSLVPMVIGRTLQGAAMGVIPLGISVMRDTLPPDRMGSAMGLLSSSLGVGGALGLPASGLIAQHFTWHMLFICAAAISAIAIVLIAVLVPESPVRTPGRFDIIGAAGLAAGLVSLLLALSKGSNWGWTSATTLGLFAAGLLILLAWGAFELRTREPLVDLRTTARPNVLFTNLGAVVIGFAMYTQSLILPQLLQLPKATGYGLGLSMVAAGLCMAPGGLMMMVVSPVSARLSRARGPKISLMAGAALIAAGYALGLVLLHEVWQVIVVSSVIAAGIAFAFAAMPALIMSAVPLSETASANGINSLMRSIGMSTAGAAIGVVLANTAVPFGPVSLPSMTGFHIGFAIACGASVAAILIAAMIPGGRFRPEAVTVPAASHPRLILDDSGIKFHDGSRNNYGAPSGEGVTLEIAPDGRAFFSGQVKGRPPARSTRVALGAVVCLICALAGGLVAWAFETHMWNNASASSPVIRHGPSVAQAASSTPTPAPMPSAAAPPSPVPSLPDMLPRATASVRSAFAHGPSPAPGGSHPLAPVPSGPLTPAPTLVPSRTPTPSPTLTPTPTPTPTATPTPAPTPAPTPTPTPTPVPTPSSRPTPTPAPTPTATPTPSPTPTPAPSPTPTPSPAPTPTPTPTPAPSHSPLSSGGVLSGIQ